jgi:tripartite-type tricarboxylate transporter receptor subunit TctC
MTFPSLRRCAALGFVLAISSAGPLVNAAPWPDHPITFVAPFSPGGSLDLIARLMSKAVGTALHQTVIIENRPGAGGMVGSAHVARSAKDGYTYLLAGNGIVINSLIQPEQPYKDSELTPVGLLSINPSIIVTSPSNPARDLKDFIARARAKHVDRITFATAGSGSTPDLVAEMLREATGVPIQSIAYKSGSDSVTAVMGSQVEATSEAAIVTLPLIKSGKLKALALTLPHRISAAPEIPTAVESGFPDVRIGHWTGLFAPTGTPADVLDKMNAAIQAAMKSPDVIRTYAQYSIESGGGSRASFVKFTDDERVRLSKLVKASQMKGAQ